MTRSKNVNNRHRVIIVGLDGASWEALNPLIQEGLVPTIEMLCREGCSGVLQSTIPPITPPAWTSLVTGVNPGKHGIFDMTIVDTDYHQKLPSSFDIQADTLWDLIENSVVIDFPVSYPPNAISGVMISGMFTPHRGKEFTHPKALRDEILHTMPHYKFDLHWERYRGRKEQLLTNLYGMTEDREYLLFRFLNTAWNLFFIVFTGTDRLQHVAWNEQELKDYYCYLDQILEKVLQKIENTETILLMVSDHGFDAVSNVVNINTFLYEEGYLNLKKRVSPLRRLGVTEERIFRLLNKFQLIDTRLALQYPAVTRFTRKLLPRSSSFDLENDVEWSKTEAFFSGYGIYINDTRFRKGIVTDDVVVREGIIEKLKSIRDPASGKRVIENIYTREDIYVGSNSGSAPDLVIIPKRGYSLGEAISSVIEPTDFMKADHRPEGVCIVFGPGIKKGKTLGNVSICDIAPTTLHILGFMQPGYMDGTARQEIFQQDSDLAASTELKIISERLRIKKNVRDLKKSGKLGLI
ncbi:MAG: alkaline phosphatase family protein [Theionarchaea archaeon]|nr:alkaline phosphatase family protein [Theionarchaea archaeon]